MVEIRYGTDGWLGALGRELTFHNVRIFTQAYTNYLLDKTGLIPTQVLINYDPRTISKKLALESANIFSLNGIKTYLTHRDVPIPAAALYVAEKKLAGAMNFTGGSKDLHFNGVKVLNEKGIQLMPSESTLVEREIDLQKENYQYHPQYPDEGSIFTVDISSSYLKYLESIIDFEIIRKANLKIIIDNLYGSTRDYVEELLSRNGIEIMSVHNYADPSFGEGGLCLSEDNLRELSSSMVQYKGDIGIGVDINGGSCALMDTGGKLVDTSHLMPLLLEYLIQQRKKKGGIVKSLISTLNVDKVASKYKRELFETPVGNKYLSDYLMGKKAFLAVSGSGGIALDKKVKIIDGLLTGMLVTEMIAHYGCKLGELIKEFESEYPRLFWKSIRIDRTKQREQTFCRLVQDSQVNIPGMEVKSTKRLDGIKFNLDQAWFLIRKTGDGRYYKIYAEADSQNTLEKILRIGGDLLG